MGFFFRKSIKAGPLRINLSKSGIGLSAGVKGARISTGPRGTELHLGRKGIYYRQKLGSKGQAARSASNTSGAPLYPLVNLDNSIGLTYQSGYFDVVRALGLPDEQVTTGLPEAQIANTLLIYRGRGVVFLVYEKENWTNIGNARYLGTVAFHPGRVLHITVEEFRPLLEAFAQEQDEIAPAPAAAYSSIAPKKRRWPTYLFILLALGTVGKIIEQVQTSNPVAVSPTAQASPSPAATPSPQQANHRRAQSQKAASTLNSAPVIISEAPSAITNETSPRPTTRALSIAPSTSAAGVRSSSGRTYILGPRGGCYYISGSGGKVYVDHSYCY